MEEDIKQPVKASTRAKPGPEFFPVKRRLEDLWHAVFPVGTEWDNMDKIRKFNWSFTNLEGAFEEGGELYGKTIYLFSCTEPQGLVTDGGYGFVFVPVVVAVVSTVPPSDKIGINSVQMEKEEIVPMKAMKMAWVPYVPAEDSQRRMERLKTRIFVMSCTQRRCTLDSLKIERKRQFDYCLPYFKHLKVDRDEDGTEVTFVYPSDHPIVSSFDWKEQRVGDFANDLIEEGQLEENEKDAFVKYVKEQVRERKREQREAREARERAIGDEGCI